MLFRVSTNLIMVIVVVSVSSLVFHESIPFYGIMLLIWVGDLFLNVRRGM